MLLLIDLSILLCCFAGLALTIDAWLGHRQIRGTVRELELLDARRRIGRLGEVE